MQPFTEHARAEAGRWPLWIGLGLFAAFLPGLGVLPYHVPLPGDSASAAALSGYNTNAAYAAALLLALAALAACVLSERLHGRRSTPEPAAVPQAESTQPLAPLWLGAVAATALVLYCPFFLARYGPYREDSYFLSVLHRMAAGQAPYRDFESLYGPLMLYVPYWWSQWFGFSMTAFLGLIAVMEAGLYVVLLVVVQRHVRGWRAQAALFLVLVIFLFDVLLGTSWNGFRRMMPVFALLIVAREPFTAARVASAGVFVGLGAAYSHEFGALALLSVIAIYGLELLQSVTWRRLATPIVLTTIAAVTWYVTCRLVLGPVMPAYLENAVRGASRFASEASFAFFWTVNSLATFAFLAVAVVVVGSGLGRWRRTGLGAGDRLFVGGLVYALLAMRGGLNRVDMWHVATPMLPLILAFALPWRTPVVQTSGAARRLAAGLIAVMAATYLAGLAPHAQYLLSGLARGAIDAAAGRRFEGQVVTRAPTIEPERTSPDPAILALGAFLAGPEQADRPVVPYSTLWHLDKRAGFVKTTYPTDDFLLSDAMGDEVRGYLDAHPDALVLIREDEHARLLAATHGEDQPVRRVLEPTLMKRILTWLSTTEFVEAEAEQIQKARRWERTVGRYVIANYRVVKRFDAIVVMSRQ